jgi:RNA polymerase sigma-B factor
MLASDRSERLLRRYASGRRPEDREEIFHRFRPLARKLAHRYARVPESLDDLEQVAALGLLKAIDRFDPSRGFAFTSFAVPTILGELRRSFRDTAWAAHVPRALQERVVDLRDETEAWTARHGRSPTVSELATALGAGEEEVLEALQASSSRTSLSLEGGATVGEEDDGAVLSDRLGGDDPGFELVEDRASLAVALPSLTPTQREVLQLRFGEELKQSEIAERIGVSQMQVSRVLRAALRRLETVASHQSRGA